MEREVKMLKMKNMIHIVGEQCAMCTARMCNAFVKNSGGIAA